MDANSQALLNQVEARMRTQGPRPRMPDRQTQLAYDFTRMLYGIEYARNAPEDVTWSKEVLIAGATGGRDVVVDAFSAQTPSPAGTIGDFAMSSDPKLDGGAIGSETVLNLVGTSVYCDLNQPAILVANRGAIRRIFEKSILEVRVGNDRKCFKRGYEGVVIFGADTPADAAAAVNATSQQLIVPDGKFLKLAPSVVGKGSNLQFRMRFDTGAPTWPGSSNIEFTMSLHFLQGRKS